MKKLFLTLLLVTGLVPRPAQAMDSELSKGLFSVVVATLSSAATVGVPYFLASDNIFPFNTTTKKYQTWLLTGACGFGSGLVTKLQGEDNITSFLVGVLSFIMGSQGAYTYGSNNLSNAIRNNDKPRLLNMLSKPGVFAEIDNFSHLTHALSMPDIRPETIKMLIEHSDNINLIDSTLNTSALTNAIRYKHSPKILQLIVNKGADVNTSQKNYDGNTPLMRALFSTPPVTPEIFRQQLEILFGAGADPHITNNAGQNAFDLANNLPAEHSAIFTEMTDAKEKIDRLLPFLRAFEIQEQ